MTEKFDYALIDKILEEHESSGTAIIAILQDIQEHYRYLPREIFPYLSRKLRVPQARIYSVATFYENFSLNPKGKFVIKVCDGTACHVKGSTPILDALRTKLNIKPGQDSSDDMLFTVDTVSCLGACGLAPVMVVNDEVHGQVRPADVDKIIDAVLAKEKTQSN